MFKISRFLSLFISLWLSVSCFAEVLEFSIPGCTPCAQMAPDVDALIAAGQPIHKVETTIGSAVCQQYQVTAFPTQIVIQNGKVVDRHEGWLDRAGLEALCAKATPSSVAATQAQNNFTAVGATPQLNAEIKACAEDNRKKMAIYWLGQELPNWSKPCAIKATVGDIGNGGATTFIFDKGEVFNFRMNIQGTRERLLDSVIPHEVSHTIFASHFRQPLPRWADEGACVSVEHSSEIARQDRDLMQFLKTGRGIPFNQLLAMKDYPSDVMPLYAEGYSVSNWLIQQRGARYFVEFVGNGLKDDNWTRAIKECYGYNDTLSMQNTWNDWVKQGSPKLLPVGDKTAVAAATVAPATATAAISNDPLAAVCEVSVATTKPGVRDKGHGTLVDKNAVITNNHIFKDANTRTAEVKFGDVVISGTVTAVDENNDLAMIRLSSVPPVKPIVLNVTDEAPSGKLSICSINDHKGYVKTTGTPNGFMHPSSPNNPDSCMKLAGAKTDPGDSGGPVVDEKMQLVGVHWGNDGSEAFVCVGKPLLAFFHVCGCNGCSSCGESSGPPQGYYQEPQYVQPRQQVQQGPSQAEQIRQQLGGVIGGLQADINGLKTTKQDKGDYATKGELPVIDMTGVASKSDVAEVKNGSESLIESVKSKLSADIVTAKNAAITTATTTATNAVDAAKTSVKQDAAAATAKVKSDLEQKVAQAKKDVVAQIPQVAGYVVKWGVGTGLAALGITGGPALIAAGLVGWLVTRANKKILARHGIQEGRGTQPFRT